MFFMRTMHILWSVQAWPPPPPPSLPHMHISGVGFASHGPQSSLCAPLCHPGPDPGSSRDFPDRCHRWRAGATAGSGATAVLDPGSGTGVTRGRPGRQVGSAGVPDASRDEMCACGSPQAGEEGPRVLPVSLKPYPSASRMLFTHPASFHFVPFFPPPGFPERRDPDSRVSCAGACACRRAYRGGAVRAPDCARETQGAPLPCVSQGFFRAGANGETKRLRGCRLSPPATYNSIEFLRSSI